MVKVVSKLVIGSSSFNLILTDKQMKSVRAGASILISNDGDGDFTVEILFREKIRCSNATKSADAPVLSPGQSSSIAIVPSPAPGKSSVPTPLPALLDSSSAKKKETPLSPVKEKKGKKKPPPPAVDPLVKVEKRLRKMGYLDNGQKFSEVYANLEASLKKEIHLQSYLWKEYAIDNRLPGYEDAASRRKDAIIADSSHLPSKHKKISAFQKVVASGNAGPCLRPPPSAQALTHLEKKEEEKDKKLSPQETQKSSGGETGQVETSLARECPPVTYSSVASKSPFQEKSDEGPNPTPKVGASREDPRGSNRNVPAKGGGRGRNARQGRKSSGR